MSLKSHVDASGFPLQIAVANTVSETCKESGWTVRYKEHSWENRETKESGFIDLVLSKDGVFFLVLECKRVRDFPWIFLAERNRQRSWSRAKAFVSNKPGRETKRFEWLDLAISPATLESQFCVVPGAAGDQRGKPLLERTAADLIASTEALACEDLALNLDDRNTLRVYLPIVVTTAPLQLCSFEVSEIDIKKGTIEDPAFAEIPFLRFRKQLNPIRKVPSEYSVFGDSEIAAAKENTVFVVNAQHLVELLDKLELDNTHENNRYLT
ncbi:MAG: hypothetical protein HYZ17_07690 [Betaproteobacteria bacterium]|nr:hypothetical protein [Betaproteobacteria bacterium]